VNSSTTDLRDRRKKEIIVFLVLAVFLAPVVAEGTEGGYGFAVWMYQMIAGPPGFSAHN
jgi:nitrate reductase NapE